MRIRGAIFDLDGTLLDSMPIWDTVAADYLCAQGITPRPELRAVLRTMSLVQAAAYLRREYDLPMEERDIMAGIDRRLENFYIHTAPPKAGVKTLLSMLRANGVKMCVATATDRYLVEAALRRNEMLAYFSRIFTCTEVGAGKDRPDIFLQALTHLGTPMAATPVFEDALYAAMTAKKTGFPLVAVYDPSAAGDAAALRRIADKYITAYDQLQLVL